MRNRVKLLLASASPRRLEILERLGFSCEVLPSGLDEASIRHQDAEKQTLLLARSKAAAVAKPQRLTVAADTVVVLESQVFEKPENPQHAKEMLQMLSGRAHWVYTAVALVFPDGLKTDFLEKTRVFFREIPEEAITAYIATPAPYDKAGGYAVQDGFGMAYIRRIEGCYFNVMGFPASRFMQALSENHKSLPG